MTIALKRVELSNIRSHAHVVFEPEPEGITALSGANGTGKSTIVDSIAWAIFGTKPKGVSKTAAIYRTGAVFGKDKCFARVDLLVDGQPLRIERRMVNKGGTVECDIWQLDTDADGNEVPQHLAGPGVSHAESYIRQRLKMDEKGFLAAILVQQKQVDNLISATPRERAQVIEKLTGISAITSAMESAREETNSLRKVAALSDVSDETLAEIRSELEETARAHGEHTEAEAKGAQAQAQAAKDVSILRGQVDTMASELESMAEVREGITRAKALLTSQERLLATLVAEKDEKRKHLSRIAQGASLGELGPQVQKLRTDIRTAQLAVADVERTLAQERAKFQEAEALVARSSIKDHAAAIRGRDQALERLQAMDRKRINLEAADASARSEIGKLTRAVTTLTEGDGTCPTCLQHVEDLDGATAVLTEELEEAKGTMAKAKEFRSTLAQTRTTGEEALAKFEALVTALETVDTLDESIGHHGESLDERNGEIRALEGTLQALEKVHDEAKRQEATKGEYDRLLERAQTLSRENGALEERLARGEEKLKALGNATPTQLDRLRKKLDAAIDQQALRSEELSQVRINLNVAAERMAQLTDKVDNYQRQLDKHREMLKTLEVSATTTKVIEEFRENRILNSIPVIEGYASDLVNRFTEGKFTRLRIDSRFNTTVVLADGSERAVGLLSGGELSAAAMALRLSISMLLNGGASRNLIILDEVLVSQDANRVELILSTIKEVCKGQVVLIAHNGSTDAIADRVVELGTRK